MENQDDMRCEQSEISGKSNQSDGKGNQLSPKQLTHMINMLQQMKNSYTNQGISDSAPTIYSRTPLADLPMPLDVAPAASSLNSPVPSSLPNKDGVKTPRFRNRKGAPTVYLVTEEDPITSLFMSTKWNLHMSWFIISAKKGGKGEFWQAKGLLAMYGRTTTRLICDEPETVSYSCTPVGGNGTYFKQPTQIVASYLREQKRKLKTQTTIQAPFVAPEK
ncbi:hypothetical protein HAX54_052630, partial [Datura stramonium]|nr:hypothetical protein [Datura stramonium]